jgi:hypothetical protein
MMHADARRPEPADFLEVKGWMPRIGFQQCKGFFRKLPN